VTGVHDVKTHASAVVLGCCGGGQHFTPDGKSEATLL
jgi:hypothetical protein